MAKKKSIIGKKEEAFFESYLNNPSPTGHEVGGQKMWRDYISKYVDDIMVDPYGTVVGVINPGADFKLAIEAHSDEISWIVSHISKDGYVYVKRNGGMDHMIAPSKRVNIHLRKGGIVKGVFGWPAIHLRDRAKEEKPSLKNLALDLGCESKEEVEKMGVHIGCVVTYEDEFIVLNKKYYTGRALDNRAGGFMIAQVARLLHENKVKLPFTLYVVNSVQEEVGLRGAQMIAERLNPNAAIVTDVGHDTTTPGIDRIMNGEYACGKGPILTYAPAVHNKLLDHIIDQAEKHKIDFQRDVASRVTGTDTDAFAYSNAGVPSALISLPLKYMHTTVETTAKSDVEDTIRLIYESVVAMDPKFNFNYL